MSSENMMNRDQAAKYCGVPAPFLANAARRRTGPPVFKLSQRTVLYSKVDLDKWLATTRIEPKK